MRSLRTAAALAALLLPSMAAAQAKAPACDRRCLLHTLTEYTEAITDNDTSRPRRRPCRARPARR